MDPDEALRMIRLASHELAKVSDDETLDLLLDTFRGLDEWLSKGGFLPSAWQPGVGQIDPDYVLDRIVPLGPPNPAHGELPDEEDGHGLDWRQAPAAVDGVTGRCDCGVSFGSAQTVRELVDRYEEHIRAAGVPELALRELEPDVKDSSVCCPDCGDTLGVMVREVDHRRGAYWTGDGEIVVGKSNDVQTEEVELFCHQGHGHFRVPDVADYR